MRTKVRGFSLAELLVAMALGMVILGVVTYAFSNTSRASNISMTTVELHHNARVAFSMMEKDVQSMHPSCGIRLERLASSALTGDSGSGTSGDGWEYFDTLSIISADPTMDSDFNDDTTALTDDQDTYHVSSHEFTGWTTEATTTEPSGCYDDAGTPSPDYIHTSAASDTVNVTIPIAGGGEWRLVLRHVQKCGHTNRFKVSVTHKDGTTTGIFGQHKNVVPGSGADTYSLASSTIADLVQPNGGNFTVTVQNLEVTDAEEAWDDVDNDGKVDTGEMVTSLTTGWHKLAVDCVELKKYEWDLYGTEYGRVRSGADRAYDLSLVTWHWDRGTNTLYRFRSSGNTLIPLRPYHKTLKPGTTYAANDIVWAVLPAVSSADVDGDGQEDNVLTVEYWVLGCVAGTNTTTWNAIKTNILEDGNARTKDQIINGAWKVLYYSGDSADKDSFEATAVLSNVTEFHFSAKTRGGASVTWEEANPYPSGIYHGFDLDGEATAADIQAFPGLIKVHMKVMDTTGQDGRQLDHLFRHRIALPTGM